MVPEPVLVWPYVDPDRGKEKNRTELDPIWIERKEKQRVHRTLNPSWVKTEGARLQDRLIRTLNPRPDLGERNRKKKREEGDSNQPEISPNPNHKIPSLVRRSRSGTGKEKRERLTDPDRIGKEQTVTLPLTVISNQERKDGLEGVFSYLGIPCAVTTACRRTGRRAGQGTVARLLGSGPLSHGRAHALTKRPTAAAALRTRGHGNRAPPCAPSTVVCLASGEHAHR